MKGHVGSFLLGLGLAGAAAFVYDKYQRGEINLDDIGERIGEVGHDVAHEAERAKDRISEAVAVGAVAIVDINHASAEDFERIGVHDQDLVDKLIEGRPYRNKMDLLTRMIVPEDVYAIIKNHIEIARPDESVKLA
jgi:hypothetical protein